MVTWSAFEAAAPELAADALRLLERRGVLEALLATVRGDEPPRIHVVNVGIVDGRLYTFAAGPKRTDLERDGRVALHAHQDADRPDELAIRGRARAVADAAERATVAAAWPFEPDASFGLFELDVAHVVAGYRASPDAWPPRYVTWTAAAGEPPSTR